MTDPTERTTSDRTTSDRAEAARAKILASGNPDLINQLYLIEATQGAAARNDAQETQLERGRAAGPGLGGFLLGGAALAGGAWLGAGLAGMAMEDELREAFATLAEEYGLSGDGLPGDGLADAGAAAPEDAGGLFDGLDDLFDI